MDTRKSPSKPLDLSFRRKLLIHEFKKLDMEQVGSTEWCWRLFDFMVKKDNLITWADVEYWVANHPWIKFLHGPSMGTTMVGNETSHVPTLISEESSHQLRAQPSARSAHSPSSAVQDRPELSSNSPPNLLLEQPPSNPVPDVSTTSTTVPGGRQLAQHYFQSGFHDIAVLHHICTEMPHLRECLIPLREIHEYLRGEHDKHFPPGMES